MSRGGCEERQNSPQRHREGREDFSTRRTQRRAGERRGRKEGQSCAEGRRGAGRVWESVLMRRLRRNLIRIAGLLALGAATTVAVAWGVAIRGVSPDPPALPMDNEMFMISGDDVYIFWKRTGGRGSSCAYTYRYAASDLAQMSPEQVRVDESGAITVLGRTTDAPPHDRTRLPADSRGRIELRIGFPLLALWCGGDSMKRPRTNSMEWRSLIWVRRDDKMVSPYPLRMRFQEPGPQAIGLPVGVLASGFALNTMFYAGAWWVALFGVTRARRWNRRRRGLCGRCAYDLRGLEDRAKCPECGTQ